MRRSTSHRLAVFAPRPKAPAINRAKYGRRVILILIDAIMIFSTTKDLFLIFAANSFFRTSGPFQGELKAPLKTRRFASDAQARTARRIPGRTLGSSPSEKPEYSKQGP